MDDLTHALGGGAPAPAGGGTANVALWFAFLAALWLLWWRKRRRAAAAPLALRSGATSLLSSSDLEDFETVSPAHVRRAVDYCRQFHRDFQATFGAGALAQPAAAVRRLFASRAGAVGQLNQLRMRLPNDLDLEKRLVELTDAADGSMLDHIEDARQRCGAPLVHPGQVGDAWYGRWYRAANDVLR